MADEIARVIAWTRRDGIKSVSEEIAVDEAHALAALSRESNPAWLFVFIEIEGKKCACEKCAIHKS